MEYIICLTKINKTITSARIGTAHPRAIPAIAAADNPPLFFVLVTTVFLTHLSLSTEKENKRMHQTCFFHVERKKKSTSNFSLVSLFIGYTKVILCTIHSKSQKGGTNVPNKRRQACEIHLQIWLMSRFIDLFKIFLVKI